MNTERTEQVQDKKIKGDQDANTVWHRRDIRETPERQVLLNTKNRHEPEHKH